MDDLTVGPVLTWSTEAMLGHVDKLLKIPGASQKLFCQASQPFHTMCLPVIFGLKAQWRSILTSYGGSKDGIFASFLVTLSHVMDEYAPTWHTEQHGPAEGDRPPRSQSVVMCSIE